jgi:hypothetical protein
MSIDVTTFCRYLTRKNQEWRDEDWAGLKLVKAIKGKPVKGYAHFNIDGFRGKVDQESASQAVQWFGELVGRMCSGSRCDVFFCPIPDSGCTIAANRPSKVLSLVQSALQRVDGPKLWDGLRWARQVPKAAETNIRDPQFYYDALTTTTVVPSRPEIILFDDVCTSGAHLKAAAARIREQGGSCNHAVCFARTALDQSRPGLGRLLDDLGEWAPR